MWSYIAAGLLVAIPLVAWTLMDPRFRRDDGAIGGAIAFPIGCASAVVIFSAATAIGQRIAGLWAALLVVGQAAALQLVDAGPFVRYQHYGLHRFAEDRWALAVIGAQALCVVLYIARHEGRARRAVRRLVRPWQAALVATMMLLTAATVSRRPEVIGLELVFAWAVHMVALGTAWIAAGSVARRPWRQLIDRLRVHAAAAARRFRVVDPLVAAAAVWVVTVSAALAWISYERMPHVPDEIAYLLQARYFAAGKIALPAPPVAEAFDFDLMTIEADRWYSLFPPGWPAVLAIGVLVNMPWLVNPVLAGLTLLLVANVVARLYTPREARVAVVLLALSPWYIFMAMSYMSHTFSLALALASAALILRSRAGGRLLLNVPAGIAAGAVTLVRPLEGLVIASVIGLGVIWPVRRVPRWKAAASFAAGTILGVAPGLAYNAVLTGSPTRFPLMAYFDRLYGPGANALGFGPDRGFGWTGLDPFHGHSPLEAVINASLNTFAIDVELFGWACGSLLAVAWFLATRRCWRGEDLAMIGVALAVVVAQSLYWFSGGPDFGARYWYPTIVPLVVLSVRGLECMAVRLDARGMGAGWRVRAFAGVLSLASLVAFVPWRAADKYHHYRGVPGDAPTFATTHGFGRSLVLVQGTRHHHFAPLAVQNPLDLDADAPVFAWDRNAAVRERLLETFADRPVWIVEGAEGTNGPYRIVAGPLDPGALRAKRDPSPVATDPGLVAGDHSSFAGDQSPVATPPAKGP